jgi:hypothetical protein
VGISFTILDGGVLLKSRKSSTAE